MVAKLGVLEVAYGDIFRYFRRYAMIVVLVTSLRAYAALARLGLPRRLWTHWTIRVIVFHATRQNSQKCRSRAVIGRQRLSPYEAHGNELELHNYRQLEAEWQTGHRQRPLELWETTLGRRTTPTGKDAEAAGSERPGGLEQRDGSKRRGSSVLTAQPVRLAYFKPLLNMNEKPCWDHPTSLQPWNTSIHVWMISVTVLLPRRRRHVLWPKLFATEMA